MEHLAISFYNFFELSGLVILVFVFSTALLSPEVRRAGIWFNLLSAAILSTVSQVLLLGRQIGRVPARGICFLQATLVYPLTVLCSLVGAALLLQVYLSMVLATRSRMLHNKHILLINFVPILVSISVLILSFAVGATDPSIAHRDASAMRCHFVSNLVPNIATGLSMVGGVMIMVLQVLVIKNLRQQRSQTYKETMDKNKLSPRVVIRVLIFNAIMTVVMICGASVWFIHSLDDAAKFRFSNLTMALLPFGEGIIFGTQNDIVNAWLTWLRIKGRFSGSLTPSEKV